MDTSSFIELFRSVGFPSLVALYVLTRIEPQLRRQNSILSVLATKLGHADEALKMESDTMQLPELRVQSQVKP